MVTREAGSAPSYLIGTIHGGVSLDHVIPDAEPLVADARLVVTELDMRSASEALGPLVQLPADDSLPRHLGADLHHRVVHALHPLTPEAITRLEPWAVHATLLMSAVRQHGRHLGTVRAESDPSMDLAVQALAHAHRREVAYLETVHEQVSMFQSISDATWVEQISDLLDGNGAEGADELLEAYLSGREDEVTRIVFPADQLGARSEYYDALIFSRNEQWLERLMPDLRDGGVVIAVGLAHLLGDRGLVAQLRSRGWAVTRRTSAHWPSSTRLASQVSDADDPWWASIPTAALSGTPISPE